MRSVNEFARRSAGGEANYFARQQEGEAQCISKHIEAVDACKGAEEVTADHFHLAGAAGSQDPGHGVG